jgi:hypothetical protein
MASSSSSVRSAIRSVPMLDFSASGSFSTTTSPWSMIAIRSQCSASSM